MDIVVVGLGEVGKALHDILEFERFGKDEVHGVDPAKGLDYEGNCDYLHICIPYSDKFVDIVNGYIRKYNPKLTINHSSVPIGTTEKLEGKRVHSPVRGKHPNIARCLKDYVKYIGADDIDSGIIATKHMSDVFRIHLVGGIKTTELMKIASLSKYLVYLAVADEINNACKVYGVDYKWVQHWEKTQNDEIDKSYSNMKWPVLSAPKGKIGGHCVLPVSKLLVEDDTINSPLVDMAYRRYADD